MDFGRIFSSAFRYAFHSKRTGLMFIPVLITIIPLLFLMNSFLDMALSVSAGASLGSLFVALIPSFIITVVIFIFAALLQLYLSGVITANSMEYWKGNRDAAIKFDSMKGRYLSLLGAVILVAIINIVVMFVLLPVSIFVPFLSNIITIVVSWFFLFVLPAVVISRHSAIAAVKDSFRVFMEMKLDVILFWLITSILSLVLVLVALIPLLIGAFPVVVSGISMILGNISPLQFLMALKQNVIGVSIGLVITGIVLAYMDAFKTAATAFFYADARHPEPKHQPATAPVAPARKSRKKPAKKRK